jgi:hypothetical protein
LEASSLAKPSHGFAITVSAICGCIVRAQCQPDAALLRERHAELTRFVVAQQARMPDYLRWPFRLATLFFDFFGLVHAGRFFHSQDQDARWRQIQAWRSSALPPARDFIRFYESLVLYRWYSEHEQ